MSELNLLSYPSRVEAPFVKVTFGDPLTSEYTFGVFEKVDLGKQRDSSGIYRLQKIKYPNYIQSLVVSKINGQVNQYTLVLTYPITSQDDPNFFEKIFSSISKSRKIVFSYGDACAPTYIYRDEEAIITKIATSFSAINSTIQYTISAVSSSIMSSGSSYNFNARTEKPSKVIKELLYNNKYGLLEVFPGMKNKALVEQNGLIPEGDNTVKIERKINISALDYLKYLVSCMTVDGNTLKKSKVFSLMIVDDTSGVFGGQYFKINTISKKADDLQTYEIDIGYPSQNVVTNFQVDNNENYSIFYEYQKEINDSEYAQRINDNGEIEEVYAPVISSGNTFFETNESDKTWWTKVTEYPISVTLTLKGLLRPAILMTHVRLNVYFYGRKHISSGLYIITKQEDTVDFNGYRTQLSLTRIGEDNSYTV